MAVANVELSVVVPLYNEEESVGPLHREIRSALDGRVGRYEILYVDDGSTDGTFLRLKEIAAGDDHVRLIRFRRNYGQTPGMQAGFDHARGDVVVTMDGDLQNDPADIGLFLDKIDEGYDVVCGWRRRRQDKMVTRKVPSWIANRLIAAFTGVPIHDNGCSLKAYRGPIVRRTRLYSEMHRFIPAMMSLSGSRIAEIEVHHRARRFGKSKYGLARTGRVASDLLVVKMLTGFVTRPALWFATLSLPFLALAAVFLGLSAVQYAHAREFSSMPIIFPGAAMLFSFAFVHLILIGMFSELVLRSGIFRESRAAVVEEIRPEETAA